MILQGESWANSEDAVKEAILLERIARGDIWLNKIKYDNKETESTPTSVLKFTCPHEERVSYSTLICLPVVSATYDQVSVKACPRLCELHGRTGIDESGEYLSPSIDRQVGFGLLGLANFLANNNITYAEFGKALEATNDSQPYEGYAGLAARELFLGIQEAANIARENNMVRAFAIAPTASCSYRSRDLHGYTATPEIAPPISRTVDRDSGEFGVEQVEYGNVEIASEVGWDNYKKVADQIMIMLDRTGLLHGYSFNSWSDMVTYDEAFIEEWLEVHRLLSIILYK